MGGPPPTVRLIRAAAATTLLVVVLQPATASPDSPDVLDYRYDQGFAATGAFAGTCELSGFRPTEATPGHLRIEAERTLLRVFETHVNYTVYAPDAPTSLNEYEDGYILETVRELPAGAIEVSWTEKGHAHATNVTGANATPLKAQLAGRQWDVGSIVAWFPVGGSWFERSPDGAPGFDPYPGIPGWARRATTSQEEVAVEGDARILFFNGAVQAGSERIDLPEHYRYEVREDLAPVLRRWQVVEVHAVLELSGARLLVPASSSQLLCTHMAWSGEGTVTFRDAHGRAYVRDETLDFVKRELTVGGTLDVREAVEELPGRFDEQGWARGRATGTFTALGLDFASVRLAPAPVLPLVAVGLWTLLVGALVALFAQLSRLVGIFYTRFDRSGAQRHPTRAQLCELTRQRPGLMLRELAAETGRPREVVRHHVRVLETVGLVRTMRVGKERHVYPYEANLVQERRTLLLGRDEPVRFLVERIRVTPLANASANQELRARFGVTRMGAWKAIRRAVAAGLLEAETTPLGPRLRLPPVG